MESVKVVIYTQRVDVIENYQERRDCADQRIADFIVACEFLPVPMPNRARLSEKLIERICPSGIILTGGNSLGAYGGDAPERDDMDQRLIELSIKYEIPLYGFCRGMQSVLYYFGNELEKVEKHVAVRHYIQEGTKSYEVNSYHNQACRKVKDDSGLVVTAKSSDGVVESVSHRRFPIIGTMWHPERENPFRQKDVERVKELFINHKCLKV